MLPSFISNLIWGGSEDGDGAKEKEAAGPEHTTAELEEAGGWMLITCQHQPAESGHNSLLNSESECESVCTEGSWVVTPAPTFRGTSGQSCEMFHSMEDLLIEHPTMSVYQQAPHGSSGRDEAELPPVPEETDTNRNHQRELVLLQNRQRHQLAVHLDIPLRVVRDPKPLPHNHLRVPHLSRRALKRHNKNQSQAHGRRGAGRQSSRAQKSRAMSGRRHC